MKIVVSTRITLNRNEDKRKFNDLMANRDWTVYEAFGNGLVTFEKISEIITT